MARQAVALKATTPAMYERAQSSLLAREPADYELKSDEQVWAEKVFAWSGLYSHLQGRLARLRDWRYSWWEHWALLATYILPRRYHWLIVPNSSTRGLPINQEIIDPTGTQAMRICAAGLMNGNTSPSRPWFKLKPAGSAVKIDQAAQLWFDEVESSMYSVMAQSNFYDSMSQMYEDITTFGTSPVIVYEDSIDVIRLYNPCAGEYLLAADSTFRIESFFRLFTLTASQIVGMFGLDNCPPDVKALWQTKQGNLETERIIAHAIEPNFAIDWGGQDVGKMVGDYTYREVYWVWGTNCDYPLSLRGFKDKPFIAPRWAVTSNDPYGRSPAMDALPDIMQLQVEQKRKAQGIEKLVNPPLMADMSMKNQPSSTLPGHITYVSQLSAGGGMKPIYQVMPELEHMTADIAQVQDRIKKGFFNDLFLMIAETDKDMTAFEVAQRQQEKLQVLGPVIERLQNEALSPLIKRIVSIMKRKSLLPPLPPSLQNVPIQIEYISMLALAQRAASTAGIERLLGMAGKLYAVDQGIMDNIDLDMAMREYADDLIVPHKIMRDATVVAQLRAQRQQEQQAEKQQMQAMQAAPAAAQAAGAAKDLSNTDVGGGLNALQMMLQGIGGAPTPANAA